MDNTNTTFGVSTPHPSPTSTSQKYDRQIRIWGEHGQNALSSSSVCLINASAVGTEVLKNLVLPGIGSVTVIDGANVSLADRGNNFFVTSDFSSTTNINRAHITATALQELNSDVSVSYIPHHIQSFITSASAATAFFRKFSAVIITQLGFGHDILTHIADGCFRANVPLISVRAYGFVGILRIQIRELGFVQTRLDSLPPDLRLHQSFPELESLINDTDFSQIQDSTQAAHIPYVVILGKAIQKFRAEHNDRLPKSREDKSVFKQIVNSLRPACCPQIAENFEEALKPFTLSLCYADAGTIPSTLRELLTDTRSNTDTPNGFKSSDETATDDSFSFPETIRLSRTASKTNIQQLASGEPDVTSTPTPTCGASQIATETVSFWLHLSGVRAFIATHDRLPLTGQLPDMTADTKSYTALQRVYIERARKDAHEVLSFALKAAERHVVDDTAIPDEDSVQMFCRNLCGARMFATRSIRAEMEGAGEFSVAAISEGALEANGGGCASPFYLAIRAADAFVREHGRIPGADQAQRDADSRMVITLAAKDREKLGIEGDSGLWNDQIDEVVRYAGTEMHNIAAFMGGVAAQEITKILTRQFVPVENTIVFNFAEQTSVMFEA